MVIFKCFGVFILVLLLGLSSLYFWGKRDQPLESEVAKILNYEPLATELNGYQVIAHTNDEAYKLLSHGEEQDEMIQVALGMEWDDAVVEGLLSRFSEEIDKFLQLSEFDAMESQFPIGSKEIPAYAPLVDLTRLSIILARSQAKAGDFDSAIITTNKALKAATLVKEDRTYYLIARMIGLAMQYIVLSWTNELATENELNESQLRTLLESVQDTPDLMSDGFGNVFLGEFRFSSKKLEGLANESLQYRFKNSWTIISSFEVEGTQFGVRQIAYNTVSSLFPDFYFHYNAMINKSARRYQRLHDMSADYCNNLNFTQNSALEDVSVRWRDFIKPNSMGKALAKLFGVEEFESYFHRRCFGHFQIEATKAVLASQMYHKRNGRFPAQLEELVPDTLSELPMDPFNGKPLGYSSKELWFYSVGVDGADAGGALKDCYYHRCARSESDCVNNPTIALELDRCPRVGIYYER